MKKNILTLLLTLVILVCTAPAVLAAGDAPAKVGPKGIPCVPSLPCISETTQQSGKGTRTEILGNFGTSFISAFISLTAIASVVFIIVGGVRLHAAMGNDEAVGAAKKTLIWAIGGLVIAMLAAAIVSIVSRVNFGA